MMKLRCAILSLLLVGSNHLHHFAQAAPAEDKVDELPDFGPPPTPHYSGYLDATAGCDTSVNGDYCKIHYWLAMAECGCGSDIDKEKADCHCDKKPVILWLNGGPGSSSLLGFLQELGPLMMNGEGTLMKNPYGWTKVAHVMAMESPVGVGYSYCQAMTETDDRGVPRVCQNTDKFTASAARAALVDFFTVKFPELAQNDFYIVGESYAGVYIPTLAKELVDQQHNAGGGGGHDVMVNLKGIAVGDPCTDNNSQRNSMDALWYGHKYGLVPEAEFDLLWNQCWVRAPTVMTKGGKDWVRGHVRRQIVEQLGTVEIDWQDESIQTMVQDLVKHEMTKTPKLVNDDDDDEDKMSQTCRAAHRKFLLQTSKGLSQSWKKLFIDDYSLFGPGNYNKEDSDMARYMTRDDVRRALHVEESPVVLSSWPDAAQGFDYLKQYDACNDNPEEGAPSMVELYKYLAPKLDVVWVYNGDSDPCVSYEGTRDAIGKVGFSERFGGSYRPWFYNHTAADLSVIADKAAMFGPDLLSLPTGVQFGGHVVNYKHNLSFLTIHGSGHMVPQFRPQAALHMLSKFLRGEMLSPLLPSEEDLKTMTAKEFDAALDEWTDAAKGEAYVSSNDDCCCCHAAADADMTMSNDNEIKKTERIFYMRGLRE